MLTFSPLSLGSTQCLASNATVVTLNIPHMLQTDLAAEEETLSDIKFLLYNFHILIGLD